MTSRTAAKRYARALFDVALKEQTDLSEIEKQIIAFSDLLAAYPELANILVNPAIPSPRKRGAVVELVKRAGVATVVAKLLVLLADRDRLALWSDLVTAYRERLAEHQRILRATVTTASELTIERAQQIERSLSQATGRSVTLTTSVDPAIIGGLVARIAGTVYDGSITTQLEKLRRRLGENL